VALDDVALGVGDKMTVAGDDFDAGERVHGRLGGFGFAEVGEALGGELVGFD
jgi:hypothetical protein